MEQKESKFNIRNTISTIRKARKELQGAYERFETVSAPILRDMSLIPTIYEWFCELTSENGGVTNRQMYGLSSEVIKGEALAVERRKQFIFIVLFLYSPKRLFPDKMPSGLRRAISESLGIKCSSVISDNANDVLSRYDIYKVWAKDVESVLEKILDRLKNQDTNDNNII